MLLEGVLLPNLHNPYIYIYTRLVIVFEVFIMLNYNRGLSINWILRIWYKDTVKTTLRRN